MSFASAVLAFTRDNIYFTVEMNAGIMYNKADADSGAV